MSRERSGGHKVLCGCLTAIAVVLFLILVVAAYAVLYVPKADNLTSKLDGKDQLTAMQYKSESEVSLSAAAMLLVLQKVTDMEFHGVEIVEFIDNSDSSEDAAYGIVVYTDSIKTASTAMVNYVKFIMDKESDEVSDLNYHVSARGKAIYFGNKNGEVEFRKVIF